MAEQGETDHYRDVLGLMLENIHIAVSNDSIVVEDREFPASAHLRATLIALMEQWVDGDAENVFPPAPTAHVSGGESRGAGK